MRTRRHRPPVKQPAFEGYNTNASDIHIEPYENETVVRMRRDGMLIPYMTLSPAIHQGIVARTKILANMDIARNGKLRMVISKSHWTAGR